MIHSYFFVDIQVICFFTKIYIVVLLHLFLLTFSRLGKCSSPGLSSPAALCTLQSVRSILPDITFLPVTNAPVLRVSSSYSTRFLVAYLLYHMDLLLPCDRHNTLRMGIFSTTSTYNFCRHSLRSVQLCLALAIPVRLFGLSWHNSRYFKHADLLPLRFKIHPQNFFFLFS